MRKHLPLLVGFGMPVLLIVAVVFSIYVPRFYTKPPQVNFLFMSRGNYSYMLPDTSKQPVELYGYELVGDHLEVNKTQSVGGRGMEDLPTVYLYDVKANVYTAIPQEQVPQYKLVNTKTSPDGYEVVSGGSGGNSGIFGMFFGGGYSDYNSNYLTKSSTYLKLNLPANVYLNGQCYGASVMDCGFAGWVVN